MLSAARALSIAEDLGLKELQSEIIACLANTLYKHGERERYKALCERGLHLALEDGTQYQIGISLTNFEYVS